MAKSRKGIPNVQTHAAKMLTKEFFRHVLDDEVELATWKKFFASDDEGIAWEAFKRAVEYKRGRPIQPHEHGAGGNVVWALGSLEESTDGVSDHVVN